MISSKICTEKNCNFFKKIYYLWMLTDINGDIMKLNGLMLGAFVILALCTLTSATQDAKIYTLNESNISLNLTDNFRLISDKSTESGPFMQSFTIVGSGSKGMATLMTAEIYDEDMKMYDPAMISQIMTGGVSSVASYFGESDADNSIGNWTAVDKKGENVTVETIDTKGTLFSMFGKKMDIAFWPVKDNIYAGVISSFDKNITEQIIATLELV